MPFPLASERGFVARIASGFESGSWPHRSRVRLKCGQAQVTLPPRASAFSTPRISSQIRPECGVLHGTSHAICLGTNACCGTCHAGRPGRALAACRPTEGLSFTGPNRGIIAMPRSGPALLPRVPASPRSVRAGGSCGGRSRRDSSHARRVSQLRGYPDGCNCLIEAGGNTAVKWKDGLT